MINKPFLDILYHLSHETNLDLYPDDHGVCKLKLSNQMTVQIEIDSQDSSLYMVSVICTIPPGKFRENVLKHALYANHFSNLDEGALCFIEKISALALSKTISLRSLTGEALLQKICLMGEKADSWKKAIDLNQPAPFLIKQPPRSKTKT